MLERPRAKGWCSQGTRAAAARLAAIVASMPPRRAATSIVVPSVGVPPPHDGPPPDVAKLAPIAERNGFIIMGPPGPPPGR